MPCLAPLGEEQPSKHLQLLTGTQRVVSLQGHHPQPLPKPGTVPAHTAGAGPSRGARGSSGRCLPRLSLRARASATTVSITCCGHRCALHPTQAMCWGNSAPGGALQAAKGFVSPDPPGVLIPTGPRH